MLILFLVLLGILCLESYDLLEDGKNEILIGRDDGLLQVYGYDEIGDPEIKCKSVSSNYPFLLRYNIANKAFSAVGFKLLSLIDVM